MPTRMIRESMLDSHRYASLGDSAKLLFVHLLLLADDFGCVATSPTFLRRRAFYNSPTNEHIAKILTELADADLIRPYQHEGGQYGFIPRFRQRLQRETLKHPQPPAALLQGDQHAIDKFNKINGVTKNPTVGQQIPTVGQPPEVEVEVEVEGFSGSILEKTRAQKPKKALAQAPFVLPDDIPKMQWDAWIESRRKARKSPTDFAMRLAVSKLRELKEQGHHPAAVLAQSAFNGWSGLFPVKEQK